MAYSKRPRQRPDAFITREVDGELLVLDQENEKVHQFNSTACFIWKACSGEFTVEEIAGQMQAAFEDVEPGTIRRDLNTVLNELEALQLIECRGLESDIEPDTQS